MELNLPWALIESAQKRWSTEKMNLGQDRGGVVEKEDPFMKLLEANRQRLNGKQAALPGMPDNATYTGVAGFAPMTEPWWFQ